MEAVKLIGSRTWGEGAEEVLHFGSYAIPQNGGMLVWRENPSLFSTCGISVQEQH